MTPACSLKLLYMQKLNKWRLRNGPRTHLDFRPQEFSVGRTTLSSLWTAPSWTSEPRFLALLPTDCGTGKKTWEAYAACLAKKCPDCGLDLELWHWYSELQTNLFFEPSYLSCWIVDFRFRCNEDPTMDFGILRCLDDFIPHSGVHWNIKDKRLKMIHDRDMLLNFKNNKNILLRKMFFSLLSALVISCLMQLSVVFVPRCGLGWLVDWLVD